MNFGRDISDDQGPQQGSASVMMASAKEARSAVRSSPLLHRLPVRTTNPVPGSLHRFGTAPCACGGTCPRCRGEAPLRPKLAISEPGDAFEQEADRVADEAMRMPAPLVNASPALPGVKPKCAACEEEEEKEKLQWEPRSSGARPSPAAPPIVHEVLRSPGQPLDAATRRFMEPRFGWSFGDVRIHSNAKAAASARAVNALAYTVGTDVVFGEGQFAPASAAGQGLLVHELAHVVQESHGNTRRLARQSLDKTPPSDADTPTPDTVIFPEVTITAKPPAPGSWPPYKPELAGCEGRARFEGSETPSSQWMRHEADYPKNMANRGYTFWYSVPSKNGGTVEFWTNITNPADCRWVAVMLPPQAEQPSSPPEQAPPETDPVDEIPPLIQEIADEIIKCSRVDSQIEQIESSLTRLRNSGEGHSAEYGTGLDEFKSQLQTLKKMADEFNAHRESWREEMKLTHPDQVGGLDNLLNQMNCQIFYDEKRTAYEDYEQNRDAPEVPTPTDDKEPSDDQDQTPPEQENPPPEVPSDPNQDENDIENE